MQFIMIIFTNDDLIIWIIFATYSYILLQNTYNSNDEIVISNAEQNFQMAIDINTNATTILYFVREKLLDLNDNQQRFKNLLDYQKMVDMSEE